MKILSIQLWHSATVSYMENGSIKYIIQEEKFDNVKNSSNFPLKTIQYIAERYDLSDIDKIVFPSLWIPTSLLKYSTQNDHWKTLYTAPSGKISLYEYCMYYGIKLFPGLMRKIDQAMIWYWQKFHRKDILETLKRTLWDYITYDQIEFVEHHEAHAFSPI